MKISTVLDHIDSGHLALPEFQRGYVWNREQIRGLFGSLYRRHPVGGLLVWATESKTAVSRGDGQLSAGVVKLLLDGQQRITSLYGVVRGKAPPFFDGDPGVFKNLRFNIESESFEFFQPVKMRDDPHWIDVSVLMREGLDYFIPVLSQEPKFGEYVGRLSRVLGIVDIDLHVEEITGEDKTLDVVVDIFNRVNSGGTKLSKGDLALAKIVVDWPEGRNLMRAKLAEWSEAGFDFTMDWVLRAMNTVLTGRARFVHLHDKSSEEMQDAFRRATRQIDNALNIISGRLGLDHNQVLFGRYAIPVMVHYLDRREAEGAATLGVRERDKLLFWFVQAAMWGRYSGSTESVMDQDLTAINEGGLDRLLDTLRLWHGSFRVEPGNFTGWSLGARFYPVLYMLTRMGEARDWGTGLPLKSSLLGKMNRLEVHHVFPKSVLYKAGYRKSEVNALANFCFLTKDTNLQISNRLPEEYFKNVESEHPGALASQWIPADPELWSIAHFREFLEARKELLAAELNHRLAELLHGENHWLDVPRSASPVEEVPVHDDQDIAEDGFVPLNDWVKAQGIPEGIPDMELSDPDSGEPLALLDLAWPLGLQEELSQPVAVVAHDNSEALVEASKAGYRCFVDVEDFKRYVHLEALGNLVGSGGK